MATGNEKLMFQPFASILNPGFWQQLTNAKLDKFKLSLEPVDIFGSYSCNLSEKLPCLASFDHKCFEEPKDGPECPLYGKLVCMNMMQEFIDFDKKLFLNSLGHDIWSSICDGRALEDPERHLSKVGLLVYADLKKYLFYYWFSFPAINYPKDIRYKSQQQTNQGDVPQENSRPITEFLDDKALQDLQDQYNAHKPERTFQRGFFLVVHFKDTNSIKCSPLTVFKEIQSEDRNVDIYFAYSEPSANTVYAGWPLRNFLSLIAVQFNLNHAKVIRLRKTMSSTMKSNIQLHNSRVLEVDYELDDSFDLKTIASTIPNSPLVTGWEKNESSQLAPKRVNLSELLDPKKLAEDAVNLNLRLMKWRLLPSLDLDKIAETKCLLLGCGTLGCHIARGLLAWGIKHISIVDNSKISLSNPVRQTLYTFDDCSRAGSGRFKADAAAESLKRIHPNVDVSAHVLSIPMPGHHVAEKEIEQTKNDIEKLEKLIESHDATFLLMDTRESRWLPTVIAMSKQKLVINAAIGFDTFLLQRYGIRNYSEEGDAQSSSANFEASQSSTSKPCCSSSDSGIKNTVCQIASDKLGCYFCNDIVAPGNSTLDRTLDQQCTVSRPGVSMIVSAMAVELLASIVSSSMGPFTPAPLEIQNDVSMISDEDFGSELGIVPHSIRGNLTRYHIYMPTSPYFNKCSACSTPVVEAYRASGYEFLHRVFNDPGYLEEIAGLKDLQSVSDDVWALDSDETMEDSI